MTGEITERRKFEHIEVCLKENIETSNTGFNDIRFIHNSLPEVNYNDIDLSCNFLGKELASPILIEGMTGGTKQAKKINENLALAAQQCGIAMGVGSQRAAIEDPTLVETYYVRDKAPNVFLIGNVGAVQLKEYSIDQIKYLIEMIDADALAVHLNVAQELTQKEGDKDWTDVYEKIKQLCKEIKKPIIAKETGCGISYETVKRLDKAGVKAIDIGGLGGTSWPLIEHYRYEKMGEKFSDYGIPTAISLIECRENTKLPLIASGGLRTGIDMAKALSLGANLTGAALPFLKPANEDYNKVIEKINSFSDELRTLMTAQGCSNIDDLRKRKLIITGNTKEWLEIRGFKPEKYVKR